MKDVFLLFKNTVRSVYIPTFIFSDGCANSDRNIPTPHVYKEGRKSHKNLNIYSTLSTEIIKENRQQMRNFDPREMSAASHMRFKVYLQMYDFNYYW